MAGDWIKWSKGLTDKPEVIRLAGLLGITREAVACRLMRLWEWCDDSISDQDIRENGSAFVTMSPNDGDNVAFIDALVGTPKFADSLALVNWLRFRDGRVELPNFGRHNGETAKTRARNAKNQKRIRQTDGTKPGTETPPPPVTVTEVSPKMSPRDGDKTVTRVEERRFKKEEVEEDHPRRPDPPPNPSAADRPPPDEDPPPERESGVISPPRADVFVEVWNRAGLMPITVTGNLRKWWQKRWSEDRDFRERWRAGVERAGRSPKLRGQDPKDPDFRLHPFSFLKEPEWLVRILDWGEYDPRTPGATRPADPDEATRRTREALERTASAAAPSLAEMNRAKTGGS